MLHLHIQAAVPIFDKILRSTFGETIADSLPERVLPLSTIPVQNMQLLLDTQFRRIRELLSPGTRKQNDARAMIRGLLAISPLAGDPDLEITEKDVDKALKAIKAGRNRLEVFPESKELTVEVSPNASSTLMVRFTRKKDAHAVPFTYVPPGAGALAVEEVDKSKLYCFTRSELYKRLGVSNVHGAALRWYCGIDGDERYHRNDRYGKMELPRYTNRALDKLRQAMQESDSDKILADYRLYRKSQKGAS